MAHHAVDGARDREVFLDLVIGFVSSHGGMLDRGGNVGVDSRRDLREVAAQRRGTVLGQDARTQAIPAGRAILRQPVGHEGAFGIDLPHADEPVDLVGREGIDLVCEYQGIVFAQDGGNRL